MTKAADFWRAGYMRAAELARIYLKDEIVQIRLLEKMEKEEEAAVLPPEYDLSQEIRHAVAEHPPGSCVAVPVPMLLWCPSCNIEHVGTDHFVTTAHHTHACQKCGMTWRPALCATVGVQFLPEFKDDEHIPV